MKEHTKVYREGDFLVTELTYNNKQYMFKTTNPLYPSTSTILVDEDNNIFNPGDSTYEEVRTYFKALPSLLDYNFKYKGRSYTLTYTFTPGKDNPDELIKFEAFKNVRYRDKTPVEKERYEEVFLAGYNTYKSRAIQSQKKKINKKDTL